MSFKEGLSRIIFWSMIILMTAGIVICITGTQHNIEWYKELGVTALMAGGIWVLGFILRKCRSFLEKHKGTLLFLILSVFAIGLYAVSYISRNEPMYDYKVIYESAMTYASGGEADWAYLAQWTNNFGIFLWLFLQMTLCNVLSIPDPFVVMLAINTILAVLTGYCVFDILSHFVEDVSIPFMGLFLYIGFLPLWGGTNYFYTDSVSMFFTIAAVWMITIKGDELVGCILAGILWGIGFELKATAAVSLIAFEWVAVVKLCPQGKAERNYGVMGKEPGTSRRGDQTGWLLMFFAFLVVLLGMKMLRREFPSYQYEDEFRVPYSYWLALGIHNDGSYPGNIEFAERLLNTPGYEVKDRVANAYLNEHISDLWNPEHIISKIRYNFASGKMGLSEFNQYPTTFMHDLVNDYGKYGGYSTMFASAYFYAIILFGLYGAIHVLTSGTKDDLSSIAILTVFGLCAFLMIWESNNRQLYNHIPWYAVFGVLGLRFLYGGEKKQTKS